MYFKRSFTTICGDGSFQRGKFFIKNDILADSQVRYAQSKNNFAKL